MAKVTKTINPLHFEDLEPHRFEDLVRQLIYDFREWRTLEATGRSGSDEGFDVRAREVIRLDDVEERDEDEIEEPIESDRIWLIQCKREKSITPRKLQNYVEEVAKPTKDRLHGVIFVAPCDFSKKARDIYRARCREYGISEYHLWGRAELEDMLFQSKNDHLLFAYFGISLTVRHRSLKTQLRSVLAIKRKAIRHLGDIATPSRRLVLLRDPEEFRYPFSKEIEDFEKHPRWKVYYFVGYDPDGLRFLVRKYLAYLAEDRIHWDYIEGIDESRPYDDPWKSDKEKDRNKAHRFWGKLPEPNRGWLEIIRVVPYDKILAIDEMGDMYVRQPHIYVPFDWLHGPFEPYEYVTFSTFGPQGTEIHPKEENRIRFFPKEFPDPTEGNDEAIQHGAPSS